MSDATHDSGYQTATSPLQIDPQAREIAPFRSFLNPAFVWYDTPQNSSAVSSSSSVSRAEFRQLAGRLTQVELALTRRLTQAELQIRQLQHALAIERANAEARSALMVAIGEELFEVLLNSARQVREEQEEESVEVRISMATLRSLSERFQQSRMERVAGDSTKSLFTA